MKSETWEDSGRQCNSSPMSYRVLYWVSFIQLLKLFSEVWLWRFFLIPLNQRNTASLTDPELGVLQEALVQCGPRTQWGQWLSVLHTLLPSCWHVLAHTRCRRALSNEWNPFLILFVKLSSLFHWLLVFRVTLSAPSQRWVCGTRTHSHLRFLFVHLPIQYICYLKSNFLLV